MCVSGEGDVDFVGPELNEIYRLCQYVIFLNSINRLQPGLRKSGERRVSAKRGQSERQVVIVFSAFSPAGEFFPVART